MPRAVRMFPADAIELRRLCLRRESLYVSPLGSDGGRVGRDGLHAEGRCLAFGGLEE
jgi:hypothetical protein